MTKSTAYTPPEIVAILDKYIIGQSGAKRQVAIALRNRWRTQQVVGPIRDDITPSNMLMIGPTGVGKTEIARRLAHIVSAPFVKVEASKFTEVGYVGRDVESIIRALVEEAVNLVREELRVVHETHANQEVEEALLDLFIPPVLGNDGEAEVNEAAREKMRERLAAGLLEDKYVEVDFQSSLSANSVLTGGLKDDVQLAQLQDFMSSMLPKTKKKRRLRVEEARKVLLEEALAKHMDPDEVKAIALDRVQQNGIVFIDEIDKIATTNKDTSDISSQGVQRDLLPIVEGCTVDTKYGTVRTDYILFIAAGAFHTSKPSDLIPELQGRFPIRIELQSLDAADFYRILTEPTNALLKQYQALFASEKVQLTFTKKGIEKMAHIADELNAEIENIGARRLHTVLSAVLSTPLFDVPATILPGTRIQITDKKVEEALRPLRTKVDNAQYML